MQSDVLSLHLRLGVGTIRHFFDNREGNWRRNVSRYCFWDLYWGRAGQLLVIVPEVFAKVATWTIVSSATTFSSDARQPEVKFLHSSAVFLNKFLEIWCL